MDNKSTKYHPTLRDTREFMLMDDLDKAAARVLGCCRMVPNSEHKKFAHEMAELARHCDARVSNKQRAWLWSLILRYRKQVGEGVLIAEAQRRLGKKYDPA